ncbi:hypothetical protein FEM48_Zijuj09G0194500 [Ziziphus jujuba var. spinosa]|uniref:RING-type E3 ubiquitin transferase n=1 Tax=Ziziphus jujuba var. spinosa TaxID=714518 RepID=A0A978UUW0_ZIZJJ|nr:hypothetical protein FEM48_Zijuj09G0194500 [Ziziphus jujuba var. spinosa]
MGFLHRKLIEDVVDATYTKCLSSYCLPSNDDHRCPLPCFSFSVCSSICIYPIDDTSPPSPIYSPGKSDKPSSWLIITISVISFTFLIACGYAFYRKYYSGRYNSRRRSEPESDPEETTHDVFIDEDHGPVLDHPIWYIRTVGLQPTVINAINVFKYKKGDGLVEGTDCSVCLSEFQEDETLRLLPKCSHAFHIPCIDTWLRSHTNCPMCRAPIVMTTVAKPPEAAGVVDSSPVEENQVRVLDREVEVGEVRIGTEVEGEIEVIGSEEERNHNSREEIDGNGVQGRRRSVSFDSLSGSEINVFDVPDAGTKRIGGNKKLAKVKRTSSFERSLQSGPISMKRSVSCHGKFALCRQIQNRDSIFPLRSM